MRIAFFDSSADELTNNKKGKLLEMLAKRLIHASGYRDIHLRSRHAGLEYDIEAKNRITGHLLQGEAKAHNSKIESKELLAFVAKVLPSGQRGRTDAVFISVSDFQAGGGDYLSSNYPDGWIIPKALHFKTLVGSQIPAFLHEVGKLADEDTIRRKVQSNHGLEVHEVWLVISDAAEFLVCTAAPNLVTAAQVFAVLDQNGDTLPLTPGELTRLQAQLPDIRELKLVGTALADESDGSPRDLPSIAAGIGWFDHRFPAAPDFFVGRAGPLEEVQRVVENIRNGRTATRSIQIASRSGVGKSSLLLKILTHQPQVVSILVDGRNVRTFGDLRLLAAQFVGEVRKVSNTQLRLPRSDAELFPSLREASQALRTLATVGLIEIDQFESALSNPDVFNAVVDLVSGTTRAALNVVWVFGRKNDIALTPDATASLSLDQLNQLSHTVLLQDFSSDEGRVLLDRLSEELGQRVVKDLAHAISIFSGGFPWLHKRLCAHVLAMHQQGVSQRELVQNGLRAEDLFEEDLSVLNEYDQALLKTLATHLPNTAAELARRLEGEVTTRHLTSKLNEFLGTRLLRLSGDVYDTYNDVFKTYLVTGNIPFRSRYVFRVAPNATIELLHTIRALGPMDLSDFTAQVGGNRIAVMNKLRELRLLGLIESSPGRVQLTAAAQAALGEDTLGNLLRQRIRGNGLVSAVLDQLSGTDQLTSHAVEDILRRESPTVQASDITWSTYARLLVSWMHYSQLAQADGDVVKPMAHAPSEGLQDRHFYKAMFRPGAFMPSVRPRKVVQLMERLRNESVRHEQVRQIVGQRYAAGVIRDATELDLIIDNGTVVEIGRIGKSLIEATSPLTDRHVAQLCLAKPNIKALLDAAAQRPLSKSEQREVLEGFGAASWNNSTWEWRLGVLRTWVVTSGRADSGKQGLVSR